MDYNEAVIILNKRAQYLRAHPDAKSAKAMQEDWKEYEKLVHAEDQRRKGKGKEPEDNGEGGAPPAIRLQQRCLLS